MSNGSDERFYASLRQTGRASPPGPALVAKLLTISTAWGVQGSDGETVSCQVGSAGQVAPRYGGTGKVFWQRTEACLARETPPRATGIPEGFGASPGGEP
jgi:hypothetical protein